MDRRPELTKNTSITDFRDFYWLKEELVHFCKSAGLSTSGGKIQISERIEDYIQTGDIELKIAPKKIKPLSTFDWNNEQLTLDTIITDNYKNTENVRTFFTKEIGNHFKFNVKFMEWMKSHSGQTLGDSIEIWNRIRTDNKTSTLPKKIAPQFEYNTYIRDFLADNPSIQRDIGIKLWKIKKSLRGDNVYRREDMGLLD